jgi:hypothetical protein
LVEVPVLRPWSTSAQARQPNASVVARARTMFHAIQRVSWKWSRTAARLAIRSGSPAALMSSLSDRPAVGEVVEQPIEPVQHREGEIRRTRRQLDAGRGEERLGEGCCAFEKMVTLRDGGRHDRRFEQLPHAAVGEVALQLAGTGTKAGEACLIGGL